VRLQVLGADVAMDAAAPTDSRYSRHGRQPDKHGWKLELIERFNPDWQDLYETLNN
jgi:hypothetical protein